MRKLVRKVFIQFTGEIEQKPPMVSAVKHQGERLYKIARQGIEVERTARKVRIDELRILQCQLAGCGIFDELFQRDLCAPIG